MAMYHFPPRLLSSHTYFIYSPLRCNWEGDRGMAHQASVYDIREPSKEPESQEGIQGPGHPPLPSPTLHGSDNLATITEHWGSYRSLFSTQRTVRILFPKKLSSLFSKHFSGALTCQRLEHVFLKPFLRS